MIISDANLSDDKNITDQELNQEKLGYLYKHIRLDRNEVFYVGISVVNNNNYKRAYEKSNRSEEWLEIVHNVKYRVDIFLKDVPVSILGDKEKYFIKLYGRIDLGTGTLVNKNSGGQGCHGAICSNETRKKKSEALKGKKKSPEARKNMCGRKMSEETRNKISEFHKGHKYNVGRKHTEESKNKMRGRVVSIETLEKMRKTNKNKKVGQYDKDGNLIKEYQSISSTKLDGYHISKVSKCCNNKCEYHKGFQWRFS